MYEQRGDFSGWLCDFGYFMPGPFGMIFTILIWAAVIYAIVKVVQSLFGSKKKSDSPSAVKTLKNRYAAGEITKEEYEQIKRDIA